MPTIILHDAQVRKALGRGVAQLAEVVGGTLGPKGMNVIIDRLIGAPIVSRDGVSIAQEIEVDDPFENMGVQILREVASKTNEIVGDGTTTAIVLADALVQAAIAALDSGGDPIELVDGLSGAASKVIASLRAVARPVRTSRELRSVAVVAANDVAAGELVAQALERVGANGIVSVEIGTSLETLLEVVDGMVFDRGYVSHHMVTETETMEVLLDDPSILVTDLKLLTKGEVAAIQAVIAKQSRPLLIIAEEVAPACIVELLNNHENGGPRIAVINPPDYGHWRRATLDDIAIIAGARVIAHDKGGRIDQVSTRDLGTAGQVRISAGRTIISSGGGDPKAVAARRQQVMRQIELAPANVERDKLQERLARLTSGTAKILAGGATRVEQIRRAQLIEDAVHAASAAMKEGVVAGGGAALFHARNELDDLIANLANSRRVGAMILQSALARPLTLIAINAGCDPDPVVEEVKAGTRNIGFDARTGTIRDMFEADIIDPVAVPVTALRNAVSVAILIVTTKSLITRKPEYMDPTAGPSLGGGAEKLGRE